jgi:hypothetical protein
VARLGFAISANCLAALSRTSLYKSASFCVTPGGNGGFSVSEKSDKNIS